LHHGVQYSVIYVCYVCAHALQLKAEVFLCGILYQEKSKENLYRKFGICFAVVAVPSK
jgi:hypothetical protein